MKHRILILIAIMANIFSFAQKFNDPSNPFYWRNKAPNKDYWQQDIDYKIIASLDPKEEIIFGEEFITYTNNSPDELSFVYFNLYQNAFIKHSYLTNLQEANNQKINFGQWEVLDKGNEILSVKVDARELKKEIDGSIMKVWLPKTLKSQQSITIHLVFKTYYSKGGNTRRRMKSWNYRGIKHFNGAHWYPRLAVYDRKFGWCTDQHLNREFYGDFGNYEVSLTMPSNYLVEATGEIQNEKEVLPDTLRKKLDLSNFWNNKWDDTLHYKNTALSKTTKTWIYKARNVHDFAWIAGPLYRIHDTTQNGVKVVAMVIEPHASGWKNACSYTHKVIQVYSKDFGTYAYPKMVVADCEDGMEYPMLTMDGGSDPGYRGLLAHEVGHNWFYGMVNNNETYRAMLDEGFTQFLTSWSLEAIDGKNIIGGSNKHNFLTCEPDELAVRESRVYSSYLTDAMIDEDPTLNTHSDGFHGALGQGGGYRHVYSKTATMLYNLQYVLGDSLFSGAMKHYFNKWSFCHPYIEDFRQSIIEYTHSDLNWFFDQWIETSKHIDYKLVSIKSNKAPNSYTLKLKRKGDMQMPIDLQIIGQSGKTYNFYIPNTWFEKQTNGTTLPRWIGWDNKLKTTYETTIQIPEPIKNAQIDTTERLADINELNNSLKLPLKVRPEDFLYKNYNRQKYVASWRPDVWYNNFDGIKAGVHIEGDYMRIFHKISLDLWANTGIGQGSIRPLVGPSNHDLISFRLAYQTPTNQIMKQSHADLLVRFLDGIGTFKFGINKQLNDKLSASLYYKALYKLNRNTSNYQYLWYQWSDYSLNSSLNLNLKYRNSFEHNIDYRSNLNFRASILTYKNYSYIETEHILQKRDRLLTWKARLYARLGVNDNSTYTYESNLNAGGANGEQMIENEFTRAVTMFPSSLISSNNSYQMQKIHLNGGLNMRGYTLQQGIIQNEQGNIIPLTNQNTGYAANIQINFERISPIKWRKISQHVSLETYFFVDGGQLGTIQLVESGMSFNKSPWIADAGIGCALEIRRWGTLEKIKPLTFRFDMPLWLSHPGYQYNNLIYTQNKPFDFRFLIGIDKAF